MNEYRFVLFYNVYKIMNHRHGKSKSSNLKPFLLRFTTIDGYIMPRYAELCENRSNFAQLSAAQKLGKIRHNAAK